MTTHFFTIGHSDRSFDDFSDLLRRHDVTRVVDVRSLPGSRAFPHFDADVLAASLAAIGITHEWVPALGGRRRASQSVPFETNALWRNRSFHNYADHALGAEFQNALTQLRPGEGTIAIMCAEAVWWRCHRRIIADHLLARGEHVAHILSVKQPDVAKLTDGAVVRDRVVFYPSQ